MPESLRGKLLVASPVLADPNFERSVVLITEHNEEGAMGIVLNRPSETAAGEVVPELAEIAGDEPVYVGGPVQPDAIVLLAEFVDPEAAAWIVVADVGLAGAESELDELAQAVRRGRLYAGYSDGDPRSSTPNSNSSRGSSNRRCRRSCFQTGRRRCGATSWIAREVSTS